MFISHSSAALYLPKDGAEEYLLSCALALCNKTTELSGKALFYVISVRDDFQIHELIQNLHESMIETVVITHHSTLQDSIHGSATKNIIIFLNDLDEILSFILASSSKFDGIVDLKPRKFEKLNHYCFQNDLFEFDLTAVNKTCDFSLHINQTELDGTIILGDPVVEHTKSLFSNSVWNSRNYITFFLPTLESGNKFVASIKQNPRIKFLFEFFWRFFRGLRTVVCFGNTCFKYDPLIDLISQVDIISEDHYFTFVPDLRGKLLNIAFVSKENMFHSGGEVSYVSNAVVKNAAFEIAKKLNCEILVYGPSRDFFTDQAPEDYFKNAQANDFHMLIFDESISPNQDFSMFDFSAAIQSFSYCFATPRSSFVPQSFLPFICFSPQTWFLVLMTILSLYGAFCAFHRSQWMLFQRLYSETEQHAFANTPVLFYLYSFLVVGSPPRLLLGRVFTGKLLFLIVSLFVLVIITVYQSQMTTLLAKQVRYPEIDTLEDLKDSNLMIQTPDLEVSLQLLQDYPFYDDIKTKLIEGPYHFQRILYQCAIEFWGTSILSNIININVSNETLDPLKKRFKDLLSNFRSIVESNAIELAVSNLHYKYRGNIKVDDPLFLKKFSDFHLVKECMLTYPMTLQVQENSFLSNYFLEQIQSYVEKGLIPTFMQGTMDYVKGNNDMFIDDVSKRDSIADAFRIENLQPAFVSLIIGWILSGVVFAVELMVDISNETGMSRFTRWAKKLVCPSSLSV
ncbi:unnamed protein product [Bemisia tabaci]|uniref:Ionotropic receptor n=1 Tax=Bemisia tabaci TaxID=7038 RepID=A0A9P0AKQ4_BEMTA|nr:unnamed protein product [Bemisia tabaci]